LKKITQDERQKLAEIFTSIDSDGNGLIDKAELVATLRTHMDKFKHLAEAELDQLVSSMDKNNSGKIDFN
jgi:Ca2+-binding EF-hand superfamily protein